MRSEGLLIPGERVAQAPHVHQRLAAEGLVAQGLWQYVVTPGLQMELELGNLPDLRLGELKTLAANPLRTVHEVRGQTRAGFFFRHYDSHLFVVTHPQECREFRLLDVLKC